ncbi:MAG: cell division protein FtsZ [Pseudomonadota bacterium]
MTAVVKPKPALRPVSSFKKEPAPIEEVDLKPRIAVMGIGGGGTNAVNNMIRSKLDGVTFVVSNTDAQALEQAEAEHCIQLGPTMTKGLGAGSRPDVGQASAEETMDEIMGFIDGTHMLFVTAGMGGGTGTGAAPVIAHAAREMGILTVGVVTKPFHFEGAHRMRTAEQGIEELQHHVDSLIVIPNQNLFRVSNEKTTFAEAFKMADNVLYSGVRSITDLMIVPGLINLDFADIRSVMGEMGKSMMGTGEAEGDTRAIQAAESAIANPLLDEVSMRGAKGVLISITGGMDMTLFEVDEAANRIRDEVDPDTNIIFGSTFDEKLNGRLRVSVVATGLDQRANASVSTYAAPNADTTEATQASANPVEEQDIIKEEGLTPWPPATDQATSMQQPEPESPAPTAEPQTVTDHEVTAEVTPSFGVEAPTVPTAPPHTHESHRPGLFERFLRPFKNVGGNPAPAGQVRVRNTTRTSGEDVGDSISEIPAFVRKQKK